MTQISQITGDFLIIWRIPHLIWCNGNHHFACLHMAMILTELLLLMVYTWHITSSSHIMTHPESLRTCHSQNVWKMWSSQCVFPSSSRNPTWIRDGDSTTQWHHDWERHGPPPVQRSPPNNKCLASGKEEIGMILLLFPDLSVTLIDIVSWSLTTKWHVFIQEMEDANFNWTTIFKYILNICHKTNKSISLSLNINQRQWRNRILRWILWDPGLVAVAPRWLNRLPRRYLEANQEDCLRILVIYFQKKTFNCLTQGVWFCLIDSFLSFFQNHQIPFADRFSGMLMLTWQANNAKLHPRPGVAARDCPNHEGPAYLKESWRSDSDRSMTLVILHLHLGSVDDAFLLIYVSLILSNHLLYAVISVIKRCLYLLVVLV